MKRCKGDQLIQQIGQLDPTHAVEVDGWFCEGKCVLEQSGWQHRQLKPGEKFTPPVLLRFAQNACGIRNSQPNELS
jgi:hypothetical protein